MTFQPDHACTLRRFVSPARRLVCVVLLSLLAGSGVARAQVGGDSGAVADLILYNGKILTVDPAFSMAEAVAIQGNRILLTGSTDALLKLAGKATLKIDLKGRTVAPGLIDTHSHIDRFTWIRYSHEYPEKFRRYPLDLKNVKDRQGVLDQIKETFARYRFKPGEWVFFILENFEGSRHVNIWYNDLNRWELDRVSPDNPIIVPLGNFPDAGGLILNSAAIEQAWKDHGAFIEKYGRYWRDPSGQPSGPMEPPASRVIQEQYAPRPDPQAIAPLLKEYLKLWPAMGVTAISTRMARDYVEGYRVLEAQDELPLRIGYGFDDAASPDMAGSAAALAGEIGKGSDQIWAVSVSLEGLDGSGPRECVTSKISAFPAAHWWPAGACYLDPEYRGARGNYYKEFLQAMADNNLRWANTHIAGDRTHHQVLDILEEIEKEKGLGFIASKRWAMDHCRMVDPKDIPRIARLGVMMSCQPGNIYSSAERAVVYGEKVTHDFTIPVKTMIDAGVKVVFESDSQDDIWKDIAILITRKDRKEKVWGAHERVDRATALKMATRWAAEYLLRENLIGSIEKGKLADLIVLDRDFMTVPEDEILNTRVLITLKGGKFTFVDRSFAQEYDLHPPGAIISTYSELAGRNR